MGELLGFRWRYEREKADLPYLELNSSDGAITRCLKQWCQCIGRLQKLDHAQQLIETFRRKPCERSCVAGWIHESNKQSEAIESR